MNEEEVGDMKFVCGECQAKYQIPDERVAGRKLKIRCRKCGAAIHLRGDWVSAVGQPAPEVGWHVAVDGQQHGPYPTEQMGTMLRAGDLGWDASVWRDGYADWKDADASDTLVRAVASLAETRYSSTPSMPPGVRSSSPSIVPDFDEEEPTRMVQSGQPEKELPTRMVQSATLPTTRQRSVSPTRGISPARRPASVGPSAGLTPVEARSVSVAPVAAAASIAPLRAPAPAASLAALPMPVNAEGSSYAATNLSASPAPAPVRRGYAGGDGSGLIDIRALAVLTQSGNSRPAATEATRARATTPADVMVPLAAPISPFGNIDSLAPFERPQRNTSKALPIAIVVGSSVIAAAAFLAVFLTRKEASATVAAADLTPAPVVAAAAAPPTSPSTFAASPQPAEPAPAEPAEALAAAVEAPSPSEEQPAGDEAADESASPSPARSGGKAKAKAKAGGKAVKSSGIAAKAKADDAEDKEDDLLAPAEAPAAAPAPEKPSIDDLLAGNDKAAAPATTESTPKAAPAASRSIDDLLDDAVEKKGGGTAASASASNLAESPGRDEVKSAMQGVESEVRACAAGQTLDVPTATVAVTVTGSTGRVQSVRVTGNQGVVGSCIARVVRGAKFSPFSKPQFTFNFPYKLK